ncbi:MAG: DUF3105 domain-containing protein [Actinomycetota bacterium]
MPKRGKNWKPPPQRRPPTPEGAPPTKREERRQEAEQRRLAIRRKAARRRRLRNIAIVLVILLAGGGIAAYALTRPTPVSTTATEGKLLANTGAADAAGCGEVKTIEPYPGSGDIDHRHVDTLPALSTYPSQPPVSGPHAPIPPGPMPAGIYTTSPEIGRMIHDLEHGAVIVWYSPSIPDEQLKRITDFFSKSDEEEKVLVAPYDYDEAGGKLPPNDTMALAAWHHLQLCQSPSLAVAFQFVHSYRFDVHHPRQYKGDAREPTAAV